MADYYLRKVYFDRIKKYAESAIVGNQAFLGVKGVGKTTLFQSYFTKQKKNELAERFKNLFVFSTIDSRKQGPDLYKFMLDQVKSGIYDIPDDEVKKYIKSQLKDIDEIFETPEGRLSHYLSIIKDEGYDLILIIDQFHFMARNDAIGKEQYDVLRCFNEQNLIKYWIITDTDLRETCASKQYEASFFAQKFTNKLTIKPLDAEECKCVINLFMEQKKAEISTVEENLITELSGGIPELISMLIDIINRLKEEGKDSSLNVLVDEILAHNGCMSLFEGWISGLTSDQRKILYDVSVSNNGLSKCNINFKDSQMAELADDIGRGLLHVEKENGDKIWTINNMLFKNYIIQRGELFYQDNKENNFISKQNLPEPHVTNVYNITGNYVQNQTNNVLNIENAIAGLEDLHRYVNGNSMLLDESSAIKKLDYLPFRQEIWKEMNAEEQEKELESYAEGVFSSDIFTKDILTPEQMKSFCLTEELLDKLSDSCKTQIICGVQVYNLIQLCIDKFGLSMKESESPRGILFARAFERHLKDYAAPAYCRIPELASQKVYPTTKIFKDYPIDKTTIGTYSSILNYGYPLLADVSVRLMGRTDRDEIWWKLLLDRLKNIGDLRNECCHSGKTFDNDKLKDLINGIFFQKSFEDILIFSEIPELKNNQFLQKNLTNLQPEISLVGKTANFKVQKKGGNGNYKGIVNNKYDGSLPKKYAITMEFMKVKGKTIQVKVDKIQDNKYVLSI